MFYLEDFMEKLELMPREMQNRLKEIRDLDAQVEDTMNHVKCDVETLFSNADQLNSRVLKSEFQAIMKEGENAIKKSENKIQAANQMQKLMTKYLNRLDHELQSFKKELDTNNSGITELIEKRVLDSEEGNYTNEKKNKYQPKRYIFEGR
uniref:Inhibitor of growth protein 3 n=1 Tax=Sipha flava TaxID=143950 RepID=A0A2S2QSK8_9HEMI